MRCAAETGVPRGVPRRAGVPPDGAEGQSDLRSSVAREILSTD